MSTSPPTPISGRLTIAVEQPVYPGEVVSGQVNVHVHEPFDGTDLVLTLTGRERLQWVSISESKNSDGSESKSAATHVDELELFALPLVVCESKRYERGSHAIPFEYTLPPSATPTIERFFRSVGVMQDVLYRVDYTVHVALQTAKTNCDMRVAVPLQVAAAPEAIELGPVQRSNTEHVSSLFGLVKRGECSVSAAVDRNLYRIGDVAHVTCRVDNESSRSVSKAVVSLQQHVTVTLSNGRTSNSSSLMGKSEVRGLSAGSTDVVATLVMDLDPSVLTMWTKPLAPAMSESYSGRLMHISHQIEAKCRFSLSRSTKIAVPITVVGRSIEVVVD